jgi:sugar phosphate isomerase/epimerase
LPLLVAVDITTDELDWCHKGSRATVKIGMITDSLANLPFEALLTASARLELDMLEFACGNWSTAPHINLAAMLESEKARREFRAKVADHGLQISALNCSGNRNPDNAATARALGMHGIHFRSAMSLCHELAALGLL